MPSFAFGSSTTLVSVSDVINIRNITTRAVINEISIGGLGTTSAANEVGLGRVTTDGTTGGGALTAMKVDPDSGAAVSTTFTSWAAQPTVTANYYPRLQVNANGGIYRWVALPGKEVFIRGTATAGGNMSLRQISGTSAVAYHIMIDDF